jgi:hypothetical protein
MYKGTLSNVQTDPKQCTKVEVAVVSRGQCIAVECEGNASRIVFEFSSG